MGDITFKTKDYTTLYQYFDTENTLEMPLYVNHLINFNCQGGNAR